MHLSDVVETLSLSEDDDAVRAGVELFLSSANPEATTDWVIGQAASNHVLFAVLSRLKTHGADLDSLTVDANRLRRNRISKVLPALKLRPGRLFLSDVHEALLAHQRLLRDLTTELSRRHPFGFLLASGRGLSVRYPSYRERTTHDTDLFVEHIDVARGLLASLTHELGFAVRSIRLGRAAGRGLTRLELVSGRDGHMLYVDFFIGGKPADGRSLVPPFRYPTLFERARPMVMPGGGGLLVASPEDMLLLLAEGVQRKADFTLRRIQDTRVLLASEPPLDWRTVQEGAKQLHVQLGLYWLLSAVSARCGLVPEIVIERVNPPWWERHLLALMSHPVHGRLATKRRAQIVHRLAWISRYVWDHPRSLAAAMEILRASTLLIPQADRLAEIARGRLASGTQQSATIR